MQHQQHKLLGRERVKPNLIFLRPRHPSTGYTGWNFITRLRRNVLSSSTTTTTKILVSLGTRCHEHRDSCLHHGGQRRQPSTWLSSGSVPVVGKVERFRRGSINHSLPRTERPGRDSNPEPANHSLKRQALDNLCLLWLGAGC